MFTVLVDGGSVERVSEYYVWVCKTKSRLFWHHSLDVTTATCVSRSVFGQTTFLSYIFRRQLALPPLTPYLHFWDKCMVSSCMQIHTCTHICTHTQTHPRTYAHWCTHTHTRRCTHTHTRTPLFNWQYPVGPGYLDIVISYGYEVFLVWLCPACIS